MIGRRPRAHVPASIRRRASVRVRIAFSAASVVLVAYVVVALGLAGTITGLLGDDLEDALARGDATFVVMHQADDVPVHGPPTVDDPVYELEVRPVLSHWARVLILVTAPVLVVTTGLLTWFVSGSALRPVAAIDAEFRRLAAGHTTRRVAVPGGGDEVSRLATTLNATLDVLEASSRRQRRFVADAAHELRGPIAAARTSLEVAETYPDRIDIAGSVGTALTDVRRLQDLAEDLLVLARMEAGVGAPPRAVEIDDVLADLVAPDPPSGPPVTVEIVATPRDRPALRGSVRDLRRVMRNLVDNATRHAHDRVTVTARPRSDEWIVDVDDDGPGIAPEIRDRVFTPFFRSDDARARTTGGTGLGLAIVAETVRAHGGTVEVRDSPLGGIRFRVRLPCAGHPTGAGTGSGSLDRSSEVPGTTGGRPRNGTGHRYARTGLGHAESGHAGLGDTEPGDERFRDVR